MVAKKNLTSAISATFTFKKSLPMIQLWSIIASNYEPIKGVK